MLAKSQKGRDTLRSLRAWLQSSGLTLDMQNQENALALIERAWDGMPGTVLAVIYEAIGE